MNRNQQSNGRPGAVFSAGGPNGPEQAAAPEHDQRPKAERAGRQGGSANNKWFRWGGSLAVIIVAILIAAALALFVSFKPSAATDLVDTDRLQAVFLTNDQVYFGKISDINNKYLVLNDIYYLQTSANGTANKTATNDNNISLVKLGCELHKPQDRMIINQDQVSFWENLQDDGQVAKAVKSYQEANPNGQTCDTNSQSANPVQGSSDTSNSAQNSTNTTTTNTNNTTTNKQDDTKKEQ